MPFLNALNDCFNLLAIIPKPNSINKKILDFIPSEKLLYLHRNEVTTSIIQGVLEQGDSGNDIVFIDIGGYFSNIAYDIKNIFGDRFLGVIEDTENGHKKYQAIENKNFTVMSVARSILKENEDHLVGQAVVFSTETILRNNGIVLNNKNVGVI